VPRLKPNARRVIIMTRFNELDLLGRVMERDAALGFTWKHVRLPMIAEEDDPIGRAVGERLWPEWFTEDQITEARSNAHKWVALYQQRPSPETGEYFKVEWLKPYTTLPARKRCGFTAAATTPQHRTAVISPSTPSSASIRKGACTCSIFASRRLPTSGSRAFAIWSNAGSRWDGLRKPARPAPASVLCPK
jgi:hypothetical protein